MSSSLATSKPLWLNQKLDSIETYWCYNVWGDIYSFSCIKGRLRCARVHNFDFIPKVSPFDDYRWWMPSFLQKAVNCQLQTLCNNWSATKWPDQVLYTSVAGSTKGLTINGSFVCDIINYCIEWFSRSTVDNVIALSQIWQGLNHMVFWSGQCKIELRWK